MLTTYLGTYTCMIGFGLRCERPSVAAAQYFSAALRFSHLGHVCCALLRSQARSDVIYFLHIILRDAEVT